MKREDKARLLSALTRPIHLRTVRKTGSTCDDLKVAARGGAPDYSVLIADRQSAGRGREGRSFYSESGLFMSVLLPCREDSLPFLTHLAAVVVAEGITAIAGEEARVKWVNDVYVKGKKVAGILTENLDCDGKRRIVIGIGVNIGAPKGGFPAEIKDRAGYVECDRAALATRILNELHGKIEHFDKELIRKEYEKLCFLTGKRVVTIRGDEEREGRVIGLTEDLGLRVRREDGSEETLISGEVRLLLLEKDRP